MPTVDISHLIEPVTGILLRAGQIARESYATGPRPSVKADGSLVTEAEHAIDALLRTELTRVMPTAAWLSEESAAQPSRLGEEWAWVVDPIDGTREFVSHVPECAISVGLVRGGLAVLGAVLNPVTGEGGIGGAGMGARFWGLRTASGDAASIDTATASVSRTEVADASVEPYLDLVGTIVPLGSAAYKLLRVAAGVEHLALSVQPKSEWDVCGGVGLLAACGKEYRRIDGVPVRFNQRDTRISSGAVAGSMPLVDALLERLADRDQALAALDTRFSHAVGGMVTYLVENGYGGFNLVRHASRFVAVAQRVGAIDLPRLDAETIGRLQRERLWLEDDTLSGLKRQVDRLGYRPSPELLEEAYRGFNIVGYEHQVHGVARRLGVVDFALIQPDQIRDHAGAGTWVVADSVRAVKSGIDALVSRPRPSVEPATVRRH